MQGVRGGEEILFAGRFQQVDGFLKMAPGGEQSIAVPLGNGQIAPVFALGVRREGIRQDAEDGFGRGGVR